MVNTADDIVAAVRAGDLDGVRRLVRADPRLAAARDGAGLSAVLLARYHGQTEIAGALLAAGPALDIVEAAAVGRTERLRELLASAPDLARAYAADGFTALHLAAFFGQREAAATLLDHGAEVNAVARNSMRVAPLHSAAAGPHLALCALLLDHGADVHARQGGGWTALHAAAQHGHHELVDLLCAHGADRAARTDDGQTPADTAATAGYEGLAAALRADA